MKKDIIYYLITENGNEDWAVYIYEEGDENMILHSSNTTGIFHKWMPFLVHFGIENNLNPAFTLKQITKADVFLVNI